MSEILNGQSPINSIMITCHHLQNIAGSECMVLDFAVCLKSLGYDVTVFTLNFKPPMSELFKVKEINVYNLCEIECQKQAFDLSISFHSFAFFYCHSLGREANSYVHFSLSTSEPLEFPPLIENFFNYLYFNSEECLNFYKETVDNKIEGKIFVNSVPDDFFYINKSNSEKIKTIAIVSNHPPKEIIESVKIFKTRGISVSTFGRNHDWKAEHLSAEQLSNFDVVISIGRTVQYCLAIGLPIYCYDRYGGPGYISLNNFEKAEYYNYSGRCCNHRHSAEKIVETIIDEYSSLVDDIPALKKHAEFHYSLRKNLCLLISTVQVRTILPSDYKSQLLERFNQSRIYVNQYLKVSKLTRMLERKESVLIETNQLVNELKKRNNDLKIKIDLFAERNDTLVNKLKNKNSEIAELVSVAKTLPSVDTNKQMRLSISYNFFNGEELLEYSVRNIRQVADHISIVYQKVSNTGNSIDNNALRLIDKLLREKLVDEIQLYEPSFSQTASENEFNKREIGLQLARLAGCTHFLNMDADEFYEIELLKKAKAYILKHDIDYSAVHSYFYLKSPEWRSKTLDHTNVCFISRISDSLQHRFKGFFPITKVDPTRLFSYEYGRFKIFEPEEIIMHHMNFVRKDINSKLLNSSNADRKEFMSLIRQRISSWQFGQDFEFPNKGTFEIIKVENIFKIEGF